VGDAYNKATGARLNYQSVGSGAGIQQIKAKTVDFGATDMPLTDEALAKDGLIQFPTVIGGVVPVVNIAGIAPGQAAPDRPGARRHLPRQDHEVERRRGDRVEPGRRAARCRDLAGAPRRRLRHHLHLHELPVEGEPGMEGEGRRGHRRQLADRCGRQGQRGVSAFVQRLPNSIGYVEYAYAKQNKMAYTLLKNKDGNLSRPTPTTSRPRRPAPNGARPSSRS
jgi:phosphate transport system substrate-binding protein